MKKALFTIALTGLTSFLLSAQDLSIAIGHGIQGTKMENVNKAVNFYDFPNGAELEKLCAMQNLYLYVFWTAFNNDRIDIGFRLDYLFTKSRQVDLWLPFEVSSANFETVSYKYYQFGYNPSAFVLAITPSYLLGNYSARTKEFIIA